MPLLEESATIRRKAMEIQYGNHIAYLDAQTRLVEQQNERLVQQRKLVEIAAARQALEQQIELFSRELPRVYPGAIYTGSIQYTGKSWGHKTVQEASGSG